MLEITWVSATLTTEVGITKSIGETRGTYHLQALHRKTVRCFCYYHFKLRLNTEFKMKHKKSPNVRALYQHNVALLAKCCRCRLASVETRGFPSSSTGQQRRFSNYVKYRDFIVCKGKASSSSCCFLYRPFLMVLKLVVGAFLVGI